MTTKQQTLASELKHFVVLQETNKAMRIFKSSLALELFRFAYQHYYNKAIRSSDKERIVNTLNRIAEAHYSSTAKTRKKPVYMQAGRGGYYFIYAPGFKLILHPLSVLPAAVTLE